MRRSSYLAILLALFSTVTLTTSTFAQTSNGTIAGVVTDQTGAAVTNAKITATNVQTGETRTSPSNSVGATV